MIWRGYCDFTYATCGRCQQKFPISMMAWDDGILVCLERCKDRAINGSLEYNWTIEVSRDRQELVPDPKLIHPVDPRSQIAALPASAGVY